MSSELLISVTLECWLLGTAGTGKPLEQVDVSGLDRVLDVSNVCVTCDAAC